MPDPRFVHCPDCAGGRVDCPTCDGEGIVAETEGEREYRLLGEVAATSSDPAVVFLALAAQGIDLFGDPDEVLPSDHDASEPLAPCGCTWTSLDAGWNAKGYTNCPHIEERRG